MYQAAIYAFKSIYSLNPVNTITIILSILRPGHRGTSKT